MHTRSWGRPPPEALLRQVAACTEGYAGADLQALCTAAVMAAVRRAAPLLLELAEQEAGAGSGAAGPGAGGGVAAGAAASSEAAAEHPQLQQAAAADHPQRHGQQEGAQQLSKRQEQQRQQLLDGIEVQAGDWRGALAAAPPPCSRRHGLSALAAEAAAPLQQQELPLVAAPLQQLLAALHAADLPLPPPAAAAAGAAAAPPACTQPLQGSAGAGPAAAAAAGPSTQQFGETSQHASTRLESILLEHGALRPAPSCAAAAAREPSPAAAGAAGGSKDRRAARLAALGDEEEQLDRLGRSYPPCRMLLWGEGEQGQEAAAGAVLRLFDGEPPAAALWAAAQRGIPLGDVRRGSRQACTVSRCGAGTAVPSARSLPRRCLSGQTSSPGGRPFPPPQAARCTASACPASWQRGGMMRQPAAWRWLERR